MILNGFISVKSVIDDAYRDSGIGEDINYEDAAYWSYEALGLMNQPLQFVRKVTGHLADPDLDVTNYRAPLPCDFYMLERIAVDGRAVRYSGNSFHHLMSGDCCDANSGVSSADVFIDNFGNMFSPQTASVLSSPTIDSVTFDINDSYITLSVPTATICMAYLAFPTDAEGFPMVPDDVAYKVAMKKYLMQKLSYIEWAKDPSNSGKRALFDYNEKEWLWYVGKATSKAKMPHPEQMESIKNQVVRMIPHINSHDSFYRTLGAKQHKRIT